MPLTSCGRLATVAQITAVPMTRCTRLLDRLNKRSELHLEDAISHLVLVIVMRHGNYGLSLLLQPRKNLTVELAAEIWLLFGSPFIQQ